MKRMKKVSGIRGLYRDAGGMFYERIQSNGRNTYQCLDTTRQKQALTALDDRRLARRATEKGLDLVNPNGEKPSEKPAVSVDQVLALYERADYPDGDQQERDDNFHKSEEKRRCLILRGFFKGKDVQLLRKPKTLKAYHKYRKQTVTRGTGDRTTDLELNTLSNALNFAVHEELIEENPILRRKRFQKSKHVVHCRERCPEDEDELHDVLGHLFSDPRSESVAWQYLFECTTGVRGVEAQQFKMDAHSDEPGGLTKDGGSLRVHHAKKREGCNNHFVTVTPDLKVILEAHRKWHEQRYPQSEWYFPGRGGQGLLSKGAVTHRLDELWEKKLTRKKFTSHGGRAFYVLVRRSQGAQDSQIAWEINHKGTRTLEEVYGGVPESWRLGKGPNYSWIPKNGKPAWAKIKPLKKRRTRRKDKGQPKAEVNP